MVSRSTAPKHKHLRSSTRYVSMISVSTSVVHGMDFPKPSTLCHVSGKKHLSLHKGPMPLYHDVSQLCHDSSIPSGLLILSLSPILCHCSRLFLHHNIKLHWRCDTLSPDHKSPGPLRDAYCVLELGGVGL